MAEKKIKLRGWGKEFTLPLSHAERVLRSKDALKRWEIDENEPYEFKNNEIRKKRNSDSDKGEAGED